MVSLEDLVKNEEVQNFLSIAERQMEVLGYTEHSFRHVKLVAENAGKVLKQMGFGDRQIELAKIAGYLHDIGNAVNREDHAHSGAMLAYTLLTKLGMSFEEAGSIMMAIGNHDEKTGTAVSEISAALILADKSDVHRSRVRNNNPETFDIHDRVNYAVKSSKLNIDIDGHTAELVISIDTEICPVMDYFEIFLARMSMNRKAAAFLGLNFQLVINSTRLL